MLRFILILLGATSIIALFRRRLSSGGGLFAKPPHETRGMRPELAIWLHRLETVQIISVIVAVAAIPMTFLVMFTGSAVLTVMMIAAIPAAGLVAGLCEVAKGVIEARGILRDSQGD